MMMINNTFLQIFINSLEIDDIREAIRFLRERLQDIEEGMDRRSKEQPQPEEGGGEKSAETTASAPSKSRKKADRDGS